MTLPVRHSAGRSEYISRLWSLKVFDTLWRELAADSHADHHGLQIRNWLNDCRPGRRTGSMSSPTPHHDLKLRTLGKSQAASAFARQLARSALLVEPLLGRAEQHPLARRKCTIPSVAALECVSTESSTSTRRHPACVTTRVGPHTAQLIEPSDPTRADS